MDTEPPTTQSPKTVAQPALELTGEVKRQAAAAAPARVAATLTNVGSETVRLGYGPTLLFTDTGPSEDVTRTDTLVFDPKSRGVLRADPVQTSAGCWRYQADGREGIQSSIQYRELTPNDEGSGEYDIYTAAAAEACLPAGTYRHQDIVETPEPVRSATLTLQLDIDEQQRIAVSGEVSAFRSAASTQ
ncbi:hypothetical protein ACNO8S_08405 [Haloarcula sp. KBTZ06]|uniref:Intracellular proteinase inhibitor BsuPI domain-containing protein n=2 Tax=Haloarcula TaxID=2237 RepID=A0A5J5LKM4_HALHI|nr:MULTISPECIES: hypothetical protein [Haloarcula]KAA9410044.1 hypothetical protein EGO51_09590 [Haloarcula hispanica]MUV50934.1 hypothetical protein [Haloarcula sp. CBA1122]